MTLNRDVFLSILALDSYNRGYGQNLGGLPVVLNVTKLGNAKIVRQSDTENDTLGVNAGFYAIAYDVSAVPGFVAGGKVISYRETSFAHGGIAECPSAISAVHQRVTMA